jgi:hypothetical protein
VAALAGGKPPGRWGASDGARYGRFRVTAKDDHFGELEKYIGRIVVVDVEAPFVYVGTLYRVGRGFLELRDADVHDLRDSSTTRELYLMETSQFGVRRNRLAVQIRWDKIVSVSLLEHVVDH